MALGIRPNNNCDWFVFHGSSSPTPGSGPRVEQTDDWDIFTPDWEAICENNKHYSKGSDSKPHYRCRFCLTRTDNDTIYRECPNPMHALESVVIMAMQGMEV